MGGSEVPVEWRGRTVRAWVPDLLAAHDWTVEDSRTGRAAERARQLLLAADADTPVEWESLARLLLRAEGVASSYIEGVRAPMVHVGVAELTTGVAGAAADWVAANLRVLDLALDDARSDDALTLAKLNRWHEELMRGHSALRPELIGNVRDEQGWIGGATPLDAALVTAPVAELPALVGDLLDFANRFDIDPVLQAAVAHAQFEIVHPYGDGNGRLGRVLALWVLARRTGTRVLPPVSTAIAADSGGYLAGLTLFRLDSSTSWVRWFAEAVSRSSAAVSTAMRALAGLEVEWRQRLDAAGVRADAAARGLVSHLARSPVLTSAMAAAAVGVSERSGRTALETLHGVGIVEPLAGAHSARTLSPGRYVWWQVPEVAKLVTSLG